MKIFDTFIFYNELDLLEIRLKELSKIVDTFVLVESKLTHTGKKKPLHFNDNKHRFSSYLHKIIHIVINDYSELSLLKPYPHGYPTQDIQAGINEHIHRNSICHGLKNAKPKDIILLSDVDEIPKASAVRQLKKQIHKARFFGFEQTFHYYYFDLKSKEKWIGTRAAQFMNIEYMQYLRETTSVSLIQNGGWHFSFLGGQKKIIEKIKAYIHQEFNSPELIKRMPLYIDNNLDIFERPIRFYSVALSELPKYLRLNKSRYTEHFANRKKIDINSSLLIDEIVRLRTVAQNQSYIEQQYNRIVQSHFFIFFKIYERLKAFVFNLIRSQ